VIDRRRWLVAAGAMLVAAACGSPDAPRFRRAGGQPHDGGTLRFSVMGAAPTLDPTATDNEISYLVMHAIFDTLVDFSPTGIGLVPRLAARIQISPDGLVYRFELRPDIVFSDGVPITAAHFKYSLERALAPGSQFGQYLSDIVGASDVRRGAAKSCAGITALDDRVLEIRLETMNVALLEILTMPFATPQRREHVEQKADLLRRDPDATGPFKLESWDEGTRIVLRRNPRYFDTTRAHLDAIELRENVPRDTQFQLFERGELDTAENLAAPDLFYVLGAPAWQPYVYRVPTMNTFGSRMNVRVKPFNDRRVRQALNYALDKRHTARLLSGTTTAAHGILPPAMLGYAPDLAPYPHDVAKARALLAEAGYPDGFVAEYFTQSDEETEKVATSLQSDLAEVGVRLELRTSSPAAFETAIARPDGPPFSYISWGADFPDPSNFLEPNFRGSPHGEKNNSFYANPELDQLLEAARRSPDPAARAALYRRAEHILYEDVPWIWDYHRVSTEVVQPYVQGYTPHPIWRRDYTSAWLDLDPDGKPVPR